MGWKTVMKQQKLVEKMTIEEKAAILSMQRSSVEKLSGRPEKLTGFPSRPSFFQMDRMESENRQEQETIWD